jgi:hypothetical protein
VGSQQESMIMGPQSENLNDWFMENVEMGWIWSVKQQNHNGSGKRFPYC